MREIDTKWVYSETDKFVKAYPTPIDFSSYITINSGVGYELYKFIRKIIMSNYYDNNPSNVSKLTEEAQRICVAYINSKK